MVVTEFPRTLDIGHVDAPFAKHGSRCWHSFEIDLRNLLVEENALMGHAHRKRDSQVRVNDSEMPSGRGDSGLTTSVHVVHAREFRGGSHCNPEVDAAELADWAE